MLIPAGKGSSVLLLYFLPHYIMSRSVHTKKGGDRANVRVGDFNRKWREGYVPDAREPAVRIYRCSAPGCCVRFWSKKLSYKTKKLCQEHVHLRPAGQWGAAPCRSLTPADEERIQKRNEKNGVSVSYVDPATLK